MHGGLAQSGYKVSPTSLLLDVPAAETLALLTTLALLAKLLRVPQLPGHVPIGISEYTVSFVPCMLHLCVFIVCSIQNEVQTVLTDELNMSSQQNTVGYIPVMLQWDGVGELCGT